MKYIEKNENENLTREYQVSIDDAKLEEIINELNEKCCRATKVSVNVTGYNEKEAFEKINSVKKNEIDIIRKRELTDYNEGSKENSKTKYLYECEYFYKQNPYLAYLLTAILNDYRFKGGFAIDSSNTIGQIIDYANNDELKTYQERFAENGITAELFDEYEHNKEFDFQLLRDLYQQAKSCFKLNLLSQTVYFDSEESMKKVYKI